VLKAIFTLDYEIHGNGEGCACSLMVEPTDRMLRQFDRYGAKLTIMADIAEILKFRAYAEEHGRDDYYYARIVTQLQDAVRRGHDVQLHIHSSYFNAKHENGCWAQDWTEYNFAGLSLDRLREVIGLGKEFLETLLRPVNPNYRCIAFRAANWSVSPSKNIVQALVENGLRIDTSLFKHGRRDGLVSFDYSHAYSALVPWRVDEDDMCARSDTGLLVEFPIYSEERWLGAFLTPQRIYRAWLGRLHKVPRGKLEGGVPQAPTMKPATGANPVGHHLVHRYGWKADFNQCGGRQLICALRRAEQQYGTASANLPFVLIGHSKLFTRYNQWSLNPFLAYVAERPNRFGFGTFGDFDLQSLDALSTASPVVSPQSMRRGVLN
jgi:hypothetical protein